MFFKFDGTRRRAVDLDGMYKGQSCILVGGAPSLSDALPYLKDPRLVTLAMNNTASVMHPTMWIGADEAQNYSPSILLTPSIMKFNYFNLTKPIRHESIVPGTKLMMRDLPNMFFIEGIDSITQEDFFNRGRSFLYWRNVFMTAIQVLYRLGFTNVYLAGCSLKISDEKQYVYETKLSPEAVKYNQNIYNHQVTQLAGVMKACRRRRVNFSVVSCTPDSALNEFLLYEPIQDVVERLLSAIPAHSTRGVCHPLDKKKSKPST